MPSLTLKVDSARVMPFSATPMMAFHLRVENPIPGQIIQSVALRSQILIEAAKRSYNSAERRSLHDLFGEPERWSRTLRSLLWTHASVTIPPFTDSVEVDLLVPCTFDFNVGAAKYFHAIQEGELPLCFQFSGTIFYSAADGALQIDQIGWDKEAWFRLPSSTWREMMDHYYPNSAWLRLRRDAFERLYEYKRANGIASWEEAIENLISLREEAAV